MGMKYVCDACGAEATNEKFVTPYINDIYATSHNGVKLAVFKVMESTEINLCKDCQKLIAGFIHGIKCKG